MHSDAHNLFLAIGSCHGLMKKHASSIMLRPDVKTVKHWCDMLNVDGGFRLEEYVDAELADGQAISWCLELTLTLESIAVEADVRRIHEDGQDILVEIADCDYAKEADCSTGLLEITRRLCDSNPV
jgi:hypothetical protein